MRHIHFLLIALLLVTGLGVAQPPISAYAATTITVTTFEDDTDVGDGCSLREAIINANDDFRTHIDCPAGTGNDTILFSSILGTATFTLASALPVISDTDGLTINGAGVKITLSGNNAFRVLEVANAVPLTIQNLTLANGFGVGGGVYNSGSLTILTSTFKDNDGLDPGAGGGVYNNSGTVTITNSTFTGNVATNGGAIYNNTGTVTITNSTIYANSIWGGGTAIVDNNGTMTVKNTIIADGTGASLCAGNAFAVGSINNLSDDATCGASFTQKTLAELAVTPLEDNGGSTPTFGLFPTSVALNTGDPASCPSTDQRGIARPQGPQCDIGAYEETPISFNPASLPFGNQLVGVASAPWNVTVTNTSEASLTLGTLSITGEFSLLNNTCDGQILVTNATCSFDVTFLPLTAVAKTGLVTVPSNATFSPATLPLTGTGTAAVQLLKSAGFDTIVIPLPWRVFWPTRSLNSVLDCKVSHSPPCSVKFTGASWNYTRIIQQIVPKSGVAGDKYYFGMSSRADNIPAGGQYKAEILFYNLYNQVIGSQTLTFTDGTHGFESLTAYYTVPNTYYRILFRFTFQKTMGTAWFDSAILMRAP